MLLSCWLLPKQLYMFALTRRKISDGLIRWFACFGGPPDTALRVLL